MSTPCIAYLPGTLITCKAQPDDWQHFEDEHLDCVKVIPGYCNYHVYDDGTAQKTITIDIAPTWEGIVSMAARGATPLYEEAVKAGHLADVLVELVRVGQVTQAVVDAASARIKGA